MINASKSLGKVVLWYPEFPMVCETQAQRGGNFPLPVLFA